MPALRLGPVAKGSPGPKPEMSPNHRRTQASEGRLPRLRGFQATLGKKKPPRLPPTPPHSLPTPHPPPGPCSQETHNPWPDGSRLQPGADRTRSTSKAAPRPPSPGRRTLTRECCSKPPSFGVTCCRATDNLDYRTDRDTWGPKPGRGRGRGRGRMRGGSGHAWAQQECVAGSRACQGSTESPTRATRLGAPRQPTEGRVRKGGRTLHAGPADQASEGPSRPLAPPAPRPAFPGRGPRSSEGDCHLRVTTPVGLCGHLLPAGRGRHRNDTPRPSCGPGVQTGLN